VKRYTEEGGGGGRSCDRRKRVISEAYGGKPDASIGLNLRQQNGAKSQLHHLRNNIDGEKAKRRRSAASLSAVNGEFGSQAEDSEAHPNKKGRSGRRAKKELPIH